MFLSIWVAVMLAQAPPEAAASGSAARAQTWLTAVYPALKRGDVAVAVDGDAVTTRVVVMARSARRVPGAAVGETPMVTADLHRSAVTGRVERMEAWGPLVQTAARQALQQQIAAHPEWNLTEIATAITAAGGQYGPGTRAALLARLPRLRALLDGDATLVEARFVRNDERGPLWIVEVASPTRGYLIAVEPLGGQVVGLAVRPEGQ
jgi:hypothetical protein